MKKWIVDGEEFTTIEDAIEEIIDNGDLQEEFEEFIHDEHGYSVYLEVCDGEWETIELLQKLDVYDSMFDDWLDYTKKPAMRSALESMNVGDKTEIGYCEVEVIDDIEKLFGDARKALQDITTALESLRPIYGGSQANNLNLLIEFIDAVEEKVKKEE